MKYSNILISILLVLTSSFAFGTADNTTKKITGKQNIIIRPNPEKLYSIIESGRSVISSDGQESIAGALAALDKTTNKLLPEYIERPNTIISEGINADIDDFIVSKTSLLPKIMPISERAIIYSLDLQTDIYHLMINKINPEIAKQLAAQRKNVRMLREKDRIFGDIRDHFIAEVIRKLKNINKIQCNLYNSCSTIDFSFPSNLESLSEVEVYFSKKIEQVTSVSERILISFSANQTAKK